jgi:hypothetical protein
MEPRGGHSGTGANAAALSLSSAHYANIVRANGGRWQPNSVQDLAGLSATGRQSGGDDYSVDNERTAVSTTAT